MDEPRATPEGHEAERLRRLRAIGRLREALPKTPIHTIPYPPSLAVYLGPHTIGVLVYEGIF